VAALGCSEVQWAPAAETPAPETAPATPPASGAYGEKLDLVTDASVAESLARQKTLSFSSVRIDGEESEVSLSALTAEQILNAVATKVPTPDLDADAVGGLLQLTSRRAFDQKERTLRGNVAVSYDTLVGRLLPDASITYGQSLGAQNRAGFLVTLEHRRREERDDSVGIDWDVNSGRLDRFQVGTETERAAETNFHGSFDWKLGPKTAAFIRAEAQVASETDSGRGVEYDLPFSALPFSAGDAALRDVTIKRRLEDGLRRQDSVSLAGGANHQGERWIMDLRSSFRLSRDRRFDDRSYDFEENGVTLNYRRSEPHFPLVVGPAGDPAREQLEEVQVLNGTERETEGVASFDVTRLRQGKGNPGWFKSGAKVRWRRSREENRNDVYGTTGAGVRASEVAAGATEAVIGNRYVFDHFRDEGALADFFDRNPARFVRDEDKTRSDTDPANFDVRETVFAGYTMANLPLGRNRIVAGLRAETTASRFTGNEVSFNDQGRYAGTTRVAARRTKTDLFPGVHVSRPLTKDLTVFTSWTRSIQRPEYTDLVPARRISRAAREIEEGNADLRSTLYTNYDLAFDYAYRAGGEVSLELFYRDIRDPILNRRTLLTDGQFMGYERQRPENGGRARLQGIELTVQQELGVLHRRLEGLEFKVHYTHQDTHQEVENRPGESLPLTGRERHEVAVELAFDRNGYYASLEFEHSGHRLDSLGRRASEDRFGIAANYWNVSLSRQFKVGRVFLDLRNLTATAERSYAGDSSRPDRYAVEPRSFRLGLKWER
jgi:TonB-dependent receptor